MATIHLMVYQIEIPAPPILIVFQFCIFQLTVNLGPNFSFIFMEHLLEVASAALASLT